MAQKRKFFTLGQWNCESILTKINDLQNAIPNFDILALQETWLKENDNFLVSQYNIIRKDRVNSQGGVAFIIKSGIPFQCPQLLRRPL